MRITLKWVNRNVGEEGTDIYKSINPIDPNNLPEPIVTLPSGANSWSDGDVVRGETYYYRKRVFRGNDSVLSNDIKAVALPWSGPGPQELIGGDIERGYYGMLSTAEFFGAAELSSLVGLSAGVITDPLPNWFKFVRKGKILYFPQTPLRNNLSWQHIYQSGLAFGVPGRGPVELLGPTYDTDQYTTVSKNGNSFIVRLMKGFADDINGPETGDYLELSRNSEFSDLLFNIHQVVPDGQKGENWEQYHIDSMGGASAGRFVWVQDVWGSNRAVSIDAQTLAISGNAPNHTNTNFCWRPVLEYIENVELEV